MLFYPSEREKGKKGGKRGREKGKKKEGRECRHNAVTMLNEHMNIIGCHGTLISADVFSDNFFCRWSQKLYHSSKRRAGPARCNEPMHKQ